MAKSKLGELLKTIREENTELLVTPTIRDYLTQFDHLPVDDVVMEEVKRILQDTSNDVRHSRFGASSRGTCERQQVFKYLGMVPDEGLVDTRASLIFIDGHFRHLRWQIMGLNAGLFRYVERGFSLPELRLSTSLDAEGDDWLFELKGAWQIPKDGPSWRHERQIHTMFLASGYERASYVVEHKQSQEFKEWIVKRDESVMREVEEELERLNESVEHKKLIPVKAECRIKEGEYTDCPYRRNCLGCSSWPESPDWSR